MPEILTESFCERCGTRYTFESAASRGARLKGIKVLSRGLKNFVMSDDTSMDEAMAAARSETDRAATSQQLDAFHKTFNFCMTCRQYTCGNCWNEVDGRCLSCAPHLGHEIMPAPFPDLDPAAGLVGLNGSSGSNGHADEADLGPMAWPTSDLMRDLEEVAPAAPVEAAPAAEAAPPPPAAELAEPVFADDVETIDLASRLGPWPGSEPAAPAIEAVDERDQAWALATTPDVVDAGPVAEAETDAAEPETVEAVTVEAVLNEAEPGEPPSEIAATEPGDIRGRAAVASDQTSDLLRRFRPGQSLDAELEAFEQDHEQAPVVPAAGPASAAEPGPPAIAATAGPLPVPDFLPVPDSRPEPVAAEAPAIESEPETVAAEAPAPEPVTAEAPAPQTDVVEQPTWRITAPDATEPGPVAPPTIDSPAVAPPVHVEPQWPVQPEWPSQQPAGSPFLARSAQPTGSIESLWAESAREVAAVPAALSPRAAGGVAPCVSCGLSLSATARFCRRCGTRQG
jgi:hypothetical protein